MNTDKGYTDCEQLAAYYALYPVTEAALLWCGVSHSEVKSHLDKADKTNVRGVLSLSYMPCFAVRCRVLHEAIENGNLVACREKGVIVDEHIAPERRYVRRADLKEWMEKELPADKPEFLFDEVERKNHAAINADTFRALQADREAKNMELREINKRLEEVISERDAIKGCLEKMTAASQAATKNLTSVERQAMLRIIIGMAIDAYDYNPSIKRNQATGDKSTSISAALERSGISINSDTVRKYLTEAKDFI